MPVLRGTRFDLRLDRIWVNESGAESWGDAINGLVPGPVLNWREGDVVTINVTNKRQLNAWHLAIGPTMLMLMLLRLAWRLTHHTPAPPSDLPRSLQLVSRGTHWLFHGILLVLPVLGWVAASGYGAPVTLLRLVPLPALVAPDTGLAERVGGVHGALAWALLAVIALHVSGALYHAPVKRDGVAGRMLPGAR